MKTIEEALTSYYPDVVHMLRPYCGPGQDAEEAAQEAFLACWKVRAGIRIPEVEQYFWTVAKRMVWAQTRRQRPVLGTQDDIGHIAEQQERTAHTYTEGAVQARSFIESATDHDRPVLVARLAGYKIHEIAQLLGRSKWSVDKSNNRLKKRARVHL